MDYKNPLPSVDLGVMGFSPSLRVKNALRADHVRPSVTMHHRISCLSDFHEIRCGSSLRKVIERR